MARVKESSMSEDTRGDGRYAILALQSGALRRYYVMLYERQALYDTLMRRAILKKRYVMRAQH